MKKIEDYKNEKTAIKCETQKEWDKIVKLTGRTTNAKFKEWGDTICIDVPNCSFFENKDYIVYPASDFIEESIPEYVSVLSGGNNSACGFKSYRKEGQIFKVLSEEKGNNYTCSLGGNTYICLDEDGNKAALWVKLTKPSTKELYEAQNKTKEINQFKEGDYIVCLKLHNSFKGNTTKVNFITKQRKDDDALSVLADINGVGNGCYTLKFDKSKDLLDWRYATKEEIAEYDRLGKPYDVTTLKKESEFIVGCWYKITDFTNGYRKCSNSKLDGAYMLYDERIDSNYVKDNGSCGANNNRLQLLTDLSEIQEYLPEGHVDKIIKPKYTFTNGHGFTLEEGKIYFYNNEILLRFNKEHYCNSLWTKSNKYRNEFWAFTDRTIRLATSEEIEWFELCEKEGKYIPKPEKQVKMTKEQILEKAKKDYPVGTVFKDIKYKEDCVINDRSFTQTNSYWQNNNSLIIYYSKINGDKFIGSGCYIFKDGQWAEIISKPETIKEKTMSIKEIQTECKKRFPIGCTYKCFNGNNHVLKQDSNTYKIYNGHIYGGTGQSCLYHNIYGFAELVSLPKVEKEWQPKVGDWVTILKEGDDGFQNFNSNFHTGNKTFKIGYISDNGVWKEGNFLTESSKDEGNGVFYGRVRKALPHEIPTIKQESLVGRYVKWIKSDNGHNGVLKNHFYKINNETPYNFIIDVYGHTAKPIDKDYWELMHVGFKPKDNFVLPEKWFIKVTKENIVILGKWRTPGAIGEMDPNNPNPNGYITSSNGFWTGNIPDNHVEITFDQFKKYVLKEDNNSIKTEKITESYSWKVVDWSKNNQSLVKPITTKIDLKIKKVNSQPVKKEKKQLIIKTINKLKLN